MSRYKIYAGVLLSAVSGFGIYYFGSKGLETITHAEVFFFFSILALSLGMYLLYSGAADRNERELSKYRRPIDKFKESAEKVRVPLEECRVVTAAGLPHNRFSMDYKVEFYDSLYSEEHVINKNTDGLLYLVYNLDGNAFISNEIPLSPEGLAAEMGIRKTTYLYYDLEDPKRYYFDIEFLSAT